MAALEARQLAGETVLLMTSDHGEAFGEHGVVEHSNHLWEPLVRVPLVLHAPGQRDGELREEAVSSAHVPGLLSPLVPALARLPVPEEVILENRYARRIDLIPSLGGRFEVVRQATVRWPWKATRSSTGERLLYDLSRDPGEVEERWTEEPGETLLALLPEPLEPTSTPVTAGSLDPEQLEAMRELGYVE